MEGLRSRAINKGLSSNFVCFETTPRSDLGLVSLFVHGECKRTMTSNVINESISDIPSMPRFLFQ